MLSGELVAFSALSLVAGLLVGSFLNLLIDRLYRREQVVKGRSKCDKCGKNLEFRDLIPLLSFVLLRGKCRYCKKPIGAVNPLVEILTAVGFTLLVVAFLGKFALISTLAGLLFWLFIYSLLLITVFADIKYGIIYDEVVIVGIVLVALFYIYADANYLFGVKKALLADPLGSRLMETAFFGNLVRRTVISRIWDLTGATLAFLFFYLLHLLFKGRAMGGGDVKLSFFLGLLVGWPYVILSNFLAFLTGALVSLLFILSGKKNLKSRVPFGPFMVFGAIVAFFAGSTVLNWYLKYL